MKPDSTVVDVEFEAKKIRIGDRQYLQSISRDITERKRTQAQIERAAKEWLTTFDSITDMVSIQDRD